MVNGGSVMGARWLYAVGIIISSGVPFVERTLSLVTSRAICVPKTRVSPRSIQSTSTLVIEAEARYGGALLRKDGISFVTATAVNCSRLSVRCLGRTKVI